MTQTNPPVTEEAVERIMRAMRDDISSRARHRMINDVEYVSVLHLGELLASYCHSVNWPPRFRAAIAALTKSPPVVSEGMRMLGAADEATELKARIEAIRDERNFPAHLLAATDELLEIAEALAMSAKSEAGQGAADAIERLRDALTAICNEAEHMTMTMRRRKVFDAGKAALSSNQESDQ